MLMDGHHEPPNFYINIVFYKKKKKYFSYVECHAQKGPFTCCFFTKILAQFLSYRVHLVRVTRHCSFTIFESELTRIPLCQVMLY